MSEYKIKDNKVMKVSHKVSHSVDFLEDVVRLRAQADKLEQAANEIANLEKMLNKEMK